jgi:membrane associated rhomboid family serine protease
LVVSLESLAVRPHLGRNVQFVVKEEVRLEPRVPEILATLLTSLFLHGGLLHVLGNLWFLWIFGDNVEDRLGHGKFLAFYMLGGVAANLCHWWNDPASTVPVIGASGAVGAILGAYAITFPLARIRSFLVLFVFIVQVELPALIVLGVWFLAQLLSARQEAAFNVSGGVALWAHIGGFLYGVALMPLLAERAADRRVLDTAKWTSRR